MSPAAFLHPQNAPKSLAVGASRVLTALPRLPSWIKGATRGGEKERSGREANRRKGEVTGGTLDPHSVGNRLTPLAKRTANRFFGGLVFWKGGSHCPISIRKKIE